MDVLAVAVMTLVDVTLTEPPFVLTNLPVPNR